MADYKPNHRGVGEMLSSPEMVAEMLRRAEKGMAAGVAAAPFDANSKDGTHYKDSFTATAGVREHGSRRAEGVVEAHDNAAFYIEYGNSKIDAHHILGGAVIDAMRD